MIDEKGKLLGIINALDFVTLVFVIVVVFLGLRYLENEPVIAVSNEREVLMEVFASDVIDSVAEGIEIGDIMEDAGISVRLGRIENLVVEDGYKFVEDKDGNWHKGVLDGHSAIKVTARVKAEITDTGIVIAGNKYGVGHSLTIRAGKTKFYARVSGLEY